VVRSREAGISSFSNYQKTERGIARLLTIGVNGPVPGPASRAVGRDAPSLEVQTLYLIAKGKGRKENTRYVRGGIHVMVGTCCISFDHRDQGLRVGERLADLRPRLRRAVVDQVGELGRAAHGPLVSS
jgi:hypothetical protein